MRVLRIREIDGLDIEPGMMLLWKQLPYNEDRLRLFHGDEAVEHLKQFKYETFADEKAHTLLDRFTSSNPFIYTIQGTVYKKPYLDENYENAASRMIVIPCIPAEPSWSFDFKLHERINTVPYTRDGVVLRKFCVLMYEEFEQE